MGGQSDELTGPDLKVGVDPDAVAEGEAIAGHADGEAVLLARSGGKLFAVGAKCTHYGAPLSEGLVVDGTIRCPWHHAAFDLETGRVSRPPALHHLTCWKVEVREGKAFVRGRQDAAGVARGDGQSNAASPMVIVGAGAAGTTAAVTLRREGYSGRVILIDSGSELPTDRPNLSKDYLAGDAPEEWMPLYPETFYDEQSIELVLDSPVAGIDPGAQEIVFGNGRRQKYSSLLLATGATPIRLDFSDPGQTVYYLRTLADSRAIIDRSKAASKAVVIGASFIGLEVAASLRKRGLEVTVIAPEKLPLERVFGAELGSFIQQTHEQEGVRFILGQTVVSVTDTGVVTSGGDRADADLVVAGVGVRPNVTLAESAGLATDKGVVVNTYLETSAPGIYAAGDIAKWPDPHTGDRIRVEHWVLAERQGQCAARNMMRGHAGDREPFAAIPFFWSNHYDVAIGYSGHAASWDSIDVAGSLEEHDAQVTYRKGDKLLATATIHRDLANLETELAMERSIVTAGAAR
jgi:NADPH-dependent 2,4-dienoyl-CoA reductase/sulfur reductase-like enzyme/nitrite reductase/ring-hydroxylating ferredoxin subunit